MTDSAGSMTTNHDSPLSGVIAFGAGLGGRDLGLVQREDRPDKKGWRWSVVRGALQGVQKNMTACAPES